jgi:hypothetical protein
MAWSDNGEIALCGSLGALCPPWTPWRVASEVRMAVRVFEQPVPRPLTAVRDELHQALRRVRRQREAWERLSGQAQRFVYDDSAQCEADLKIGQSLEARLAQAHAVVVEEIASRGAAKGGRPVDGHLRWFVHRLAGLFVACTGRRPTTTTRPDSGELDSPFNRFVMEAVRQLPAAYGPFGPSRVDAACRRAVASLRDLEMADAGDPWPAAGLADAAW